MVKQSFIYFTINSMWEILKQSEVPSAIDGLTEWLQDKSAKYKHDVGNLIAEKKPIPEKSKTTNTTNEWVKEKEKTESTELLKNFKYKDLIKNPTIQEALKSPEDTEQVKKIQWELGYKPGSKNYYPQEHWKDMKEADGMAGPYTMDALINMIAEGLTIDETQQLSKDFDNKADKEKSEQASQILDAYLKLRWH